MSTLVSSLHAVLHKQRSTCLLLLASFAAWAALRLEPGTLLPPRSWNIITLCVWTAYILTKGLGRLSVWDKRELVWAVLSCAALLQFLAQDPSFRNWGEGQLVGWMVAASGGSYKHSYLGFFHQASHACVQTSAAAAACWHA
jgi:hypothetical protein